MSAPGRLLDPAALARISDLGLLARTVVEGFVSGLHRSPYVGSSVDFAEHRPYMPGDDIRRIDWRVYARNDRFYVKEFEADSNANFLLLVDVSRSMRYGTRGITKLDYARRIAACLAYFARGQRDRIGLVTFDRTIVEFIPPAAKNLDTVLHMLGRVPLEAAGAPQAGELLGPLLKVAETVRRRGILVLLSDLYQEPATVVRAVRALGHRGSDLIVFHVLDPTERMFTFEEAASFEDLETGERMPIVPAYVRDKYQALFDAHVAALRDGLGRDGVDYSLVDTTTPLDVALFTYISRREGLTRIRRR